MIIQKINESNEQRDEMASGESMESSVLISSPKDLWPRFVRQLQINFSVYQPFWEWFMHHITALLCFSKDDIINYCQQIWNSPGKLFFPIVFDLLSSWQIRQARHNRVVDQGCPTVKIVIQTPQGDKARLFSVGAKFQVNWKYI